MIVKTLQLEIDKIHRPKQKKYYPMFLSKEEVKAILEA